MHVFLKHLHYVPTEMQKLMVHSNESNTRTVLTLIFIFHNNIRKYIFKIHTAVYNKSNRNRSKCFFFRIQHGNGVDTKNEIITKLLLKVGRYLYKVIFVCIEHDFNRMDTYAYCHCVCFPYNIKSIYRRAEEHTPQKYNKHEILFTGNSFQKLYGLSVHSKYSNNKTLISSQDDYNDDVIFLQ